MIKNYFKIILRQLVRNKLFSLVNIIGLATGMAATILVFLYIQYEYSYDKFFNNYPKIFQILMEYKKGDELNLKLAMPYGLSPAIMEKIPDIEGSTRFFSRNTIVKYNNKSFTERVCFTDSMYFRVFDHDFIHGIASNAIKESNKVIVTEEFAKKYFRNETPIGKTLFFDELESFTISGVIKDVPSNSHFRSKIFAPISYYKSRGIPADEWFDNFFRTYILIKPTCSISKTEEKISSVFNEKIAEANNPTKMHLFTLEQIHFQENEKNSSKKSNLLIFLIIGIFILIIAGINYMNLSTSQYIKRIKEVGIRKVLGADKKRLIAQFFGESFLISIISAFFSIILVETFLPFFNMISGVNIDINYADKNLIIIIIAIISFTGFFAGSYPAIFLSSFKTINILKRQVGSLRSNFQFRKYLVISQFTITIILLISTGTVYMQFNYMINKNPGFNTENIIVLPLNQKIIKNYDAFKNSLLQNPSISSVSRSSSLPFETTSLINGITWEGGADNKKTSFAFNSVDYDFFRTFKFSFIEGRPFSEEFSSDTACVIVNEKVMNLMGKGSPINKFIDIGDKLKVIGLVNDFHSLPLDAYGIEPFMFAILKDFYNLVYIQLDGKYNKQTVSFIEGKWNEFAYGFPFDYKFLDDEKVSMYGDTQQTGKAFTFFVLIAILISCVGLYGLSAFTAEQKTKEIGIRKTLGATTFSVLQLLNNTFAKWVLISVVIGSPIAYYFMNNWLSKFVFHKEISLIVFIGAGLLLLFIALITVTYQTIKAAKANPVDCLKYE